MWNCRNSWRLFDDVRALELGFRVLLLRLLEKFRTATVHTGFATNGTTSMSTHYFKI